MESAQTVSSKLRSSLPMTRKTKTTLTLVALAVICSINSLKGGSIVKTRFSPSLEWALSTPFPESRSGYAAGVLDGKLVIAGGTYWEGSRGHWIKKLYSASTHAFDPVSHHWRKLPSLPISLGYPASTVVGSKLFVLGGYTGRQVNRKIFVLQKSGGRYSWRVLKELSPPRIFASALSVGNAIYLVGGTTSFEAYDAAGTCCTSRTATKTLWVFHTDRPAEGWRPLSVYPGIARWLPAVTFASKSIWLFGGLFQGSPEAHPTIFSSVLRYDLAQGRWYVMPPLTKSIVREQPLTSLAVDDEIFLFTGHKQVWQFDLRSHRYTETTPMPEGAYVDRFFWLHHRIIGAGGESMVEGPRRRSQWTFVAQIVPAHE